MRSTNRQAVDVDSALFRLEYAVDVFARIFWGLGLLAPDFWFSLAWTWRVALLMEMHPKGDSSRSASVQSEA